MRPAGRPWAKRAARTELLYDLRSKMANAVPIKVSGRQRAFLEKWTRNAVARSGTPPTFSAERLTQIIAIACERPEDSGIPRAG